MATSRPASLRLFVITFALALAATVAGCASGESGPGTDIDGGRRDGDTRADTGPGGDGGTVPCGTGSNACCAGRTCELGLRCGAGDLCCIQPGGPRCGTAADCCRGLSCEAGSCCTPRGATCTGSSDCCNGLVCGGGVCVPPTDVLPPGESECGGASQICCAGFTCTSGLVCNNDTGRCTGCGTEGAACCDGLGACEGSLACDRGTCIAPPTCGGIDGPCCDETGHPGGTLCEGTLRCVAGNCIRPTDVGGMDQPCGAHNVCDPGLMCNRTTGLCEPTPSDCGSEDMMCCDTGGSGGSCDGALNCQFGDCTACRGPSLSCVLSGIIPGNECCNGAVCRPAPLLPRCCVGQGEDCESSMDCCGFMFCRDGKCSCGAQNTFCVDSSECCDGLTCQNFQCKPEGMMCTELAEDCNASGQCCDGLACSQRRTRDEGGSTVTGTQCCAQGGTSCAGHDDCCGEMLCVDGECLCGSVDTLCLNDGDCCDSLVCIAGACRDATSCRREDTACEPAMGQCCSGLVCRQAEFGTTSYECCVTVGDQCVDNDDCCGRSQCVEGRCACQRTGSECATSFDCCEGLSCISGSCTMPSSP